MTEEELDAAVDVIAAVDAGVLQSLNQRIKQRQNPKKPLWTASGLRQNKATERRPSIKYAAIAITTSCTD